MQTNVRPLAARIQAALDRRKPACLTLPVSRLFDEEEIEGFYMDRYGAVAIAHLLPGEGVAQKPMVESFSQALTELRAELARVKGIDE